MFGIESIVEKAGLGSLADFDFPKVTGKLTVGTKDLIARRIRNRTPGQLDSPIYRCGDNGGRYSWGGTTTPVLNRWRGAGDAMAIEGGEDGFHMRGTVAQIAVVVVDCQQVQIPAISVAAISGAGAVDAAKPIPDRSSSKVS